MYGALYRNLLSPAYERLRGRAMLKYLDELEQSQWLPMKEIEDRQWRSFTEMLRHASEHVPFYKRSFEQAGIKPQDIQSRDDLQRLPFLEKRHLQENQDELIALTHRNKPLITSHSGGSTGQPVAFQYDRPHYDRRCAAWARADRWGGWEIGERQIILWLGVGSGVGKRRLAELLKERLHWAIMRLRTITCTDLSPETIPQYYEIMRKYRPRSMFAYSQSAYTFALVLEAAGLKPPPLKGIILGGEKIFPSQKEKIRDVFGSPVSERYGCQEFCNIAEECDRHEGMHINADGLLVEIVGPDGKSLPAGRLGEVVVTSLDNFAMPFIRYKLGDMGSLMDGQCACGRGLPRIKEIVGRTLDMIVTPEGRVCSGIMMPHFMKEFETVREFQFVQNSVEELTLRLVPNKGFDESVKTFLEKELRRWIGPTMKLTIEECAELERAKSGKYRMVISNVKLEDAARDIATRMQ